MAHLGDVGGLQIDAGIVGQLEQVGQTIGELFADL